MSTGTLALPKRDAQMCIASEEPPFSAETRLSKDNSGSVANDTRVSI